ncbi:MAG: glycosyltransferase family 2 protein [Rubrobacter sp.]|nr:glycosyltransferase family 2 protein [Rubrobacter sp.]
MVLAAGLAVYGLVRYRYYGGWRRLDLLVVLLLAAGLAGVSVVPQVGEVFVRLLGLENRGFALLAASNLLLFGLFLYALGAARSASRFGGSMVSALAVREYRERYLGEPPEDGKEEGSPGSLGKLLVIIPAYNEQEGLRAVLGRVPETVAGYRTRTVVVVDGATDGTEAVALERGVPVATHVTNRGQGDALRTGFEIARLEGADVAVNLDADGQYLPEEIERLVAPIAEGEADFMLGSRFLGYYEEAGSLRHAGVVFFSRLVSLLAGVRITDCTNGLRAIRGSELGKLNLREDRFNATELLLEAVRCGLRIREVPVTMLRRAEGKSKKPERLAYPLGVLRVIVQTWLR